MTNENMNRKRDKEKNNENFGQTKTIGKEKISKSFDHF